MSVSRQSKLCFTVVSTTLAQFPLIATTVRQVFENINLSYERGSVVIVSSSLASPLHFITNEKALHESRYLVRTDAFDVVVSSTLVRFLLIVTVEMALL